LIWLPALLSPRAGAGSFLTYLLPKPTPDGFLPSYLLLVSLSKTLLSFAFLIGAPASIAFGVVTVCCLLMPSPFFNPNP